MGTKTTMFVETPRGKDGNIDRLSILGKVVLCFATCILFVMVFMPSVTAMLMQYASVLLVLLLDIVLIGIAMLPKTRAGDAAKAAAITFFFPYSLCSFVVFLLILARFIPRAIEQVSSPSISLFDVTSPLRDGVEILAKLVLLLALLCLSVLLSRSGIRAAIRTYGRKLGVRLLLLSSCRLVLVFAWWAIAVYSLLIFGDSYMSQAPWTYVDVSLHASLYSAGLLAMLLWMVAKALDTTSASSLHAGGTDSERKTTSPHEESLVE